VFTADALHQVASRDGVVTTHSASGNLIAFGTRRFIYDGLRRLVGVEVGGVPVLQIRYDALGRVRERTEAGVTRRFTYLRDEVLQIDGPARVQRVPSPLLDRPVLESSPAASYLLAHDGLGSLVAACATDGSVVERYAYDEFGAPAILAPDGVTARAASAIGRAPAFQGHPWLASAGLYDVRNRVYDPGLQIFLQPDPIAFSGSWSHHGFVRYNPLSYVDPFGAFWHIVAGAIIGAAIGGIGAALSGGDWRDVLVGIGAGAVGGGLTAAGFPVAGGAIAGAIQGAWSGGRVGYRLGGTRGAVLGALGGGVLGAGLGAASGGIASRVANRIATPLYGAVFNAVSRRLSGAATANVARFTSMVVSGYAGGVVAGTFGNVTSTIALDVATGRPVTWDQLWRAERQALTVDGPLNALGAVANRFAYVYGFRGNASNRLGFEGEGLTGRAIGYEPTNGSQRINVNGNQRRPDFDTTVTLPERNAVFEVKNKQALSADDVAQIGDFAQHANTQQPGSNLMLYHRPGMDLTPVSGIGNLVPVPIPQQPLVVAVPQPIRDRGSTK
jgi:RHS repeat-associated protein